MRANAWATFENPRILLTGNSTGSWEIQAELCQIKYYYYTVNNHFLFQDFKNPKQFGNEIPTIINASDKTLTNQIRVNNVLLHDPLLVAQAFNQHLSSACSAITPDSSICGDSNNVLSSHSSLSFRRIMSVEVQDANTLVKVNRGPGLDGKCSQIIVPHSHVIFITCLSTSELPAITKCSWLHHHRQ